MNVSGEKISSGFLSDYEPLGVNGDPVYRAATQIRTLLAKDLGENVANLFATPLRDDRNNAIDWYSAEKGQATPFNALSAGEQASFTQEIKEKLARVGDLGRRLSSNPQNQTAQTYAGLLNSIQNDPDASQIFIVNNHPVIAFWGFHARQQLDIPKAATVAAAVAPSIPTPEAASVTEGAIGSLINSANLNSSPTSDVSNFNTPTPSNAEVATQPRSFWSRYGWWLLILLLLLIGTPTFLKGCSTDFPLFGDPHQHASPGPNSQGPAAATPEPSLTPPGPNSQGTAAATPEPSLTKEALKQKDLSIFNGSWNLITSLFNVKTKELITLKFYFDKSGQGTATINEKNGIVCTGSANARINSENTFSLSYSELQCTTGVNYKPASANCRVHDDLSKADCMLTCASGECNTTFQRQ
jgi:hypothetical protein